MIVIGRRDRIDLPELGYSNIKAKIDTGAYGNALHCTNIEIINRDGLDLLSFVLFDSSHHRYKDKRQYFEDFTDKLVRNSGGDTEHRYKIETEVIFLGQKFRAGFTLTDRRTMKYPILLGRKFLRERYLVDVNLKDVSYKQKQKNENSSIIKK